MLIMISTRSAERTTNDDHDDDIKRRYQNDVLLELSWVYCFRVVHDGDDEDSNVGGGGNDNDEELQTNVDNHVGTFE